ncbi:MAG: hypothetical protein FJZ47_22215 [Candidatus Tectomicrobia bacterium]|uniref:IS6 family transposase n=1 Tax=Tectimicrobiota bacterium TaxID=2528274 RepID=A0A937W3T8_UNCTE|nr:hypothetical protein [Candidatus Tectomicrobia bacterium]
MSDRHVEALMEERGVWLDRATVQRWVVKYSPLLEETFHQRKRAVGVSGRLDDWSRVERVSHISPRQEASRRAKWS